ncbi:helix-turn-helix domain-containing protein [Alsobacter metallidurans]|uniref:helix-turn-helix domain-containing protein n=1 Tax=Alsobacter metallidurans TaxID=340221 RepID=UPI00166C466A
MAEAVRELLTLDQAASVLGISAKTLRAHVDDGEIAFINVRRGLLRTRRMFDPADLDAFKSARRRIVQASDLESGIGWGERCLQVRPSGRAQPVFSIRPAYLALHSRDPHGNPPRLIQVRSPAWQFDAGTWSARSLRCHTRY